MIICWWSGGVTSAVACKLAQIQYGTENCRFIFMDTQNEHEDTYRFKEDCMRIYGKEIETISSIGDKYQSIQDVWETHNSLNVAKGAVCSDRLKRKVREKFEKENSFEAQVFGFEFEKSEFNRAMAMKLNWPDSKAIFPLLSAGMNKVDCMTYLKSYNVEIPKMYKLGFTNNNCFKTGCVQGGIGYWQKIQREFPDKFRAMAYMEHKLTAKSGYPVTMLKDQSNKAKEARKTNKYSDLVFLIKHPDFDNKSINEMSPQELEPLVDCNGFCGLNDLNPSKPTKE